MGINIRRNCTDTNKFERSDYLILVQRSLKTNRLERIDTHDPIKYLAEYKPQVFESSQLDIFKKDEALYFISGSIKPQANGSYVRNNKSVENRDLIIIDYDDLDISGDEFKQHVESIMGEYCYVTYPTVSNGIKGTRYRFIIEPERPLNKLEFEQTFKKVTGEVGLNADFSSSTFSQIQGLPAYSTNVTDYEITYNEGIPYPVAEVIQEEQPRYVQHSVIQAIPEEELDEMVANYIEADWENIENEGQYVNLHYSIIKDVQEGLITQEQAVKYVKMLANGNSEWENNNQQRLERELKNNTRPRTKWNFTSRVSLFHESEFNLDDLLEKLGNEQRSANIDEWMNDGSRGRKPKKLTFVQIATILEENIDFIVYDKREDARVAMYLEDEGIYTTNEDAIKRLIKCVERNVTMHDTNEVIFDLKMRAKYKPLTSSRYLIPVGNGVFNLKTKELEPFTPDYVFTTKIETDYVHNPVHPVMQDGWNVESWIDSIADNDSEVATTLWQVISASLNGNYSRKKSIWLVGDGNNGKGTYQDLIRNIVGKDNVSTLKINQFQERFSLSMLEGKTVNIGDDVPAGVYIDDSSNFNSVVTGDPVNIEQKMKPMYSRDFNMTVIFSTNGMPKIHNKTGGTYRRILIVPFNAKFDVSSDNRAIKEDYIKRRELLEYVLHKAIHMDFESFTEPKASKEALKDYIAENDPVADFKESFFDMYEWTRVPTTFIYNYYKEFCEENTYRPLSQIKFTKQFEYILGSDWERASMKFLGIDDTYPVIEGFDVKYDLEKVKPGKPYMTFVKRED